MRLSSLLAACALILCALPSSAVAQGWGFIEGTVTQAGSGDPLPGATVLVAGTNFGTAAEADGAYRLRLPEGAYRLRVSSVGFEPAFDSVAVQRGETTRLDVALRDLVTEMDAVTVEETRAPTEAGVYTLDPEAVRRMPTPLNDGFRALKALPGVASNNELSSQYSVRGGGYNENLIFINGFEVYMPFRPRQGEQEGLGLFNRGLTESVTFYTGGFPPRYGGKLASALDVQYIRPDAGDPLTGSAALSLLDLDVTAHDALFDGRLGWAASVRRARADRLFGAQELQGDYRPDFTDVQAALTFRLAPGHTLEGLGILADHTFNLDPDNKRTYYGTLAPGGQGTTDLKSLFTTYEGAQRDGYTTRFGGVRLENRLSPRFRFEHDAAYFETEETEFFSISGQSVLSQVIPGADEEIPLGYGRQQDEADNRVTVGTATGRGRYMLNLDRHALEGGWHARRLDFEDTIDERALHIRRSGAQDDTTIVSDYEDTSTFDAAQAGFYLQDSFDALATSGRLLLTGGVRTDYFSFNEEWTVSPRLSARFELSEQTTLTAATGLYYQKPTYREFRGAPEPGDSTRNQVNRDLQAQRSAQLVVGGEHFFPDRRLYLRAEAYYKRLTNLISYEIENVRVRYSGENDARGFAYGLDLQLRGEFVPGLESWFNYSYLVARERFLPAFQTENNQGLVPRPSDQRHTFSLFVQDYVPGDDTWKLHLRGLYGSGLPYTPPVPARGFSNGIVLQDPGPRSSGRLPDYKRLDIGATKIIPVFDDAFGKPLTMHLTLEVLNLFNMTNTVAYTWDGQFNRIPTRLTPRTINARLQVNF